jgi:antitoxin FitA
MDVAHHALNRIVPRHVLQCEGVGGVGVLPGLGQKADRVERVGRRLFLSFAFLASNDSIDSMATLTIRQLDERTKTRLRVRAAHHGRSMEEEAREILRLALTVPSPAKGNLAESIRRRFRALGGVELQVPQRDAMREPPRFGE